MINSKDNRFKCLIDYFQDRLIFDTDKYPEYFKDASEISFPPAAILFAETEEDVIQAVKLCHENGIPIIARGAGTGYTGGCVPSTGALILSLENLKKLTIDQERKIAFCGPGLITKTLMDSANRQGLFYPPDPASYDECTLGGNIAENAGGLHCKKHGVTKDYLLGLRAVTIEGNIIKTGIYAENELFDLGAVITGSEGTLVIVTEIALGLIDKLSQGPTMLGAFDDPEKAAAAVSEIIRAGIIPSVMEYMDGDAVEASNAYDRSIEIDSAEALLLFETSGENSLSEADRIENICKAHGALFFKRESDIEKSDQLWKIRRNLSKAVKASAGQKISEDVCVPPSRLPELIKYVADLNRTLPLRVNSYGHAGDGNLHVNFLTESDGDQYEALIEENILLLFKKALLLKGTLTGEHGIGLTKRDFLSFEFSPETINQMKKIKIAFDPHSLFNPGKLFQES